MDCLKLSSLEGISLRRAEVFYGELGLGVEPSIELGGLGRCQSKLCMVGAGKLLFLVGGWGWTVAAELRDLEAGFGQGFEVLFRQLDGVGAIHLCGLGDELG